MAEKQRSCHLPVYRRIGYGRAISGRTARCDASEEWIDKELSSSTYVRIELPAVDRRWENREDPEEHIFSNPGPDGPRVVLYRAVGMNALRRAADVAGTSPAISSRRGTAHIGRAPPACRGHTLCCDPAGCCSTRARSASARALRRFETRARAPAPGTADRRRSRLSTPRS